MTNEKQETINISLDHSIGGGRFIWHPCYASEQYGQQYCCLNIIVGIYHTMVFAALIVIAFRGAGSGMAGMAAAIPIQNLVWRRHTNQK